MVVDTEQVVISIITRRPEEDQHPLSNLILLCVTDISNPSDIRERSSFQVQHLLFFALFCSPHSSILTSLDFVKDLTTVPRSSP